MKNIRNFSIIAHIDHGKSTLSDRLIQICGGLSDREMSHQVLDFMDIERERGITIKAQNVTLNYQAKNGQTYQLNLIDTPGHVDFSYEVSRSLSACEGAILVVDASQGVEAQTVSNCYTAIDMNLEVISVLNKIDLPTADPDRVSHEIENIIGIDAIDAVRCSAKTGIGVTDVLEHLIQNIPPPQGDPNAPLQALVIDSWFDNYFGVVSLIRIKNGTLHKNDKIKIMSTGKNYNVEQLGISTPKHVNRNSLFCGEIGWLTCAIKDIFSIPVGDTITLMRQPATKPLPGFKKINPQVYAGLFPINSDDYENFCNALGKLSLNDSSLFYEQEHSMSLGFGFRCGFLGLLHMEIIQERIQREYNIDLIVSMPTVIYEILTTNNDILYIDSPSKFSNLRNIKEFREPISECNIIFPKEYLGNVISLCIERRGVQKKLIYHGSQVMLIYDIPMMEIVLNFFDHLKSITRGYASLNYEFKHFQVSDIVCIDILINGDCIDALAFISHRVNGLHLGYNFVNKLKKFIPRQQFDIVIQAAMGKHIIARSIVKQLRKNVLAKCHGGDVSRKKKLLQKQKEGKKRMKKIGNVELPKEMFLSVFHNNKNRK